MWSSSWPVAIGLWTVDLEWCVSVCSSIGTKVLFWRVGRLCVEIGRIWGTSACSAVYCCEPKVSLKLEAIEYIVYMCTYCILCMSMCVYIYIYMHIYLYIDTYTIYTHIYSSVPLVHTCTFSFTYCIWLFLHYESWAAETREAFSVYTVERRFLAVRCIASGTD